MIVVLQVVAPRHSPLATSPGWHNHNVDRCKKVLRLPAWYHDFEEIPGDNIPSEVERASWEKQTGNRTVLCFFVQGGTAWTLPEPNKWPPADHSQACLCPNCQTLTPWLCHGRVTSTIGAYAHSLALWSLIGNWTQNWHTVLWTHDAMGNILLPATASCRSSLMVGQRWRWLITQLADRFRFGLNIAGLCSWGC